jgi:hypothetical protein
MLEYCLPTEMHTRSPTIDFVDSLIHSFESNGESGSEDGDSAPTLAGETVADFIEDLMCLAEPVDSETQISSRSLYSL